MTSSTKNEDTAKARYAMEQCAICLADFANGDEISWSQNKQCHHMFHQNCVLRWLLKHEDCPCCRRPYLKIVDEEVSTDITVDCIDHL